MEREHTGVGVRTRRDSRLQSVSSTYLLVCLGSLLPHRRDHMKEGPGTREWDQPTRTKDVNSLKLEHSETIYQDRIENVQNLLWNHFIVSSPIFGPESVGGVVPDVPSLSFVHHTHGKKGLEQKYYPKCYSVSWSKESLRHPLWRHQGVVGKRGGRKLFPRGYKIDLRTFWVRHWWKGLEKTFFYTGTLTSEGLPTLLFSVDVERKIRELCLSRASREGGWWPSSRLSHYQ